MYRHRLPSSFIFILTHSFILYLTRRDGTICVYTFKQRCQLSDGAFSQSRVLTSRVFQSRFQKRIVQTTATTAAGRSSSTTHCCCYCCCCCCCRCCCPGPGAMPHGAGIFELSRSPNPTWARVRQSPQQPCYR